MKNKLFMKGMGFIASLMLSFCILPVAAQAEEIAIAPRSLPAAPRITFDPNGVDLGENIEITVTFMDTMNRKVPFTIELTKGAEIAANISVEDVEFQTNNNIVSMDSVKAHEDLSGMDVVTGQCLRSRRSSFKFMVQAPVDAKDFQVILKTDSSNNLYKTIISDNIPVISGLTLNAPDIVNDVDPFNVSGMAKYKNQSVPENTHMFMEIVNQDPEKPYFYEVQMVEPIIKDEYKFQSIQLPSDYEDGDYTIQVYLMDNEEYKLIGYAEKDVKFIKKPDVLQVSIYSSQLDKYYTLDNPEPGQGVTYPELYVNPAGGWYVPNGKNIQAKVILKSVSEALNPKFVVTTSFGNQEFPAAVSGTALTAGLDPLRTTQTVVVDGVERNPFIYFVYTKPDGTEKKVFVGDLEPLKDPHGYLFDWDTLEAIADAEVTLYRMDEATKEWVLWADPKGSQANPQKTNEKGEFDWNVENGQYEIRIYHPDYHRDGTFYSSLLDPEHGSIHVPYDSNIRIRLQKSTQKPDNVTETAKNSQEGIIQKAKPGTDTDTEAPASTDTKAE